MYCPPAVWTADSAEPDAVPDMIVVDDGGEDAIRGGGWLGEYNFRDFREGIKFQERVEDMIPAN
jgi:hypothetical protein